MFDNSRGRQRRQRGRLGAQSNAKTDPQPAPREVTLTHPAGQADKSDQTTETARKNLSQRIDTNNNLVNVPESATGVLVPSTTECDLIASIVNTVGTNITGSSQRVNKRTKETSLDTRTVSTTDNAEHIRNQSVSTAQADNGNALVSLNDQPVADSVTTPDNVTRNNKNAGDGPGVSTRTVAEDASMRSAPATPTEPRKEEGAKSVNNRVPYRPRSSSRFSSTSSDSTARRYSNKQSRSAFSEQRLNRPANRFQGPKYRERLHSDMWGHNGPRPHPPGPPFGLYPRQRFDFPDNGLAPPFPDWNWPRPPFDYPNNPQAFRERLPAVGAHPSGAGSDMYRARGRRRTFSGPSEGAHQPAGSGGTGNRRYSTGRGRQYGSSELNPFTSGGGSASYMNQRFAPVGEHNPYKSDWAQYRRPTTHDRDFSPHRAANAHNFTGQYRDRVHQANPGHNSRFAQYHNRSEADKLRQARYGRYTPHGASQPHPPLPSAADNRTRSCGSAGGSKGQGFPPASYKTPKSVRKDYRQSDFQQSSDQYGVSSNWNRGDYSGRSLSSNIPGRTPEIGQLGRRAESTHECTAIHDRSRKTSTTQSHLDQHFSEYIRPPVQYYQHKPHPSMYQGQEFHARPHKKFAFAPSTHQPGQPSYTPLDSTRAYVHNNAEIVISALGQDERSQQISNGGHKQHRVNVWAQQRETATSQGQGFTVQTAEKRVPPSNTPARTKCSPRNGSSRRMSSSTRSHYERVRDRSSASGQTSMHEEIREEMARARRMSIPMNLSQDDKVKTPKLNPNADVFAPTIKLKGGQSFIMQNERGMCYFRPKEERLASNPSYVISTDHEAIERESSAVYEPSVDNAGVQYSVNHQKEPVHVPEIAPYGGFMNQANPTEFRQTQQLQYFQYSPELQCEQHASGVEVTVDQTDRSVHVQADNPPAFNMAHHQLDTTANTEAYVDHSKVPMTVIPAVAPANVVNTEAVYSYQTALVQPSTAGLYPAQGVGDQATMQVFPHPGYAFYQPPPVAPGFVYIPPQAVQCPPVTPAQGNECYPIVMPPSAIQHVVSSAPTNSHTYMEPQPQPLYTFPVIGNPHRQSTEAHLNAAPVLNLYQYYSQNQELTETPEGHPSTENTTELENTVIVVDSQGDKTNTLTNAQTHDTMISAGGDKQSDTDFQARLDRMLQLVQGALHPGGETAGGHTGSNNTGVVSRTETLVASLARDCRSELTLAHLKDIVAKLMRFKDTPAWDQIWNRLHGSAKCPEELSTMQLWIGMLYIETQALKQQGLSDVDEVFSDILTHLQGILQSERTTPEELMAHIQGFEHNLEIVRGTAISAASSFEFASSDSQVIAALSQTSETGASSSGHELNGHNTGQPEVGAAGIQSTSYRQAEPTLPTAASSGSEAPKNVCMKRRQTTSVTQQQTADPVSASSSKPSDLEPSRDQISQVCQASAAAGSSGEAKAVNSAPDRADSAAAGAQPARGRGPVAHRLLNAEQAGAAHPGNRHRRDSLTHITPAIGRRISYFEHQGHEKASGAQEQNPE